MPRSISRKRNSRSERNCHAKAPADQGAAVERRVSVPATAAYSATADLSGSSPTGHRISKAAARWTASSRSSSARVYPQKCRNGAGMSRSSTATQVDPDAGFVEVHFCNAVARPAVLQ
eukprot:GHRQ01035005.1.p2 GENE.GHRQ01035005.1~~GHRQ01035005.1.p2  ORF type:complete len:118 (-),score=16.42 GHRQ01035005.1:352-705(-)